MNEHQKRLWLEMINLTQSYIEGKTDDFYSIVGNLEGALDAGDFKDKGIANQWYDCWTPLEIRRATEGNQVTREKALQELEIMNRFLKAQLCDNSTE